MSVTAGDKVYSSGNKDGKMHGAVNNTYKFDSVPLTDEDDSGAEPMIPSGGIKRDGMTMLHIAAYAVGHVYNDF